LTNISVVIYLYAVIRGENSNKLTKNSNFEYYLGPPNKEYMNEFLAELVGTALLLLLGNGVVAGVVLNKSKSQGAGWMVITLGWALAVTFAVYAVGRISGAHLNPAVTIGLAAGGKFDWALVPAYVCAQMLGAMLGSTLVWLQFLPHWAVTESADDKLACFSNSPAISHTLANCFSEFLGTFVLLFGLSALGANQFAEGLNPLVVGALVLSIGLSLGGSTGYAINPARDLGPRIMHAILPIAGKGGSNWAYAWVPVVMPILGGIAGVAVHTLLFG
jgi:glycerol uptake facilitator protein